MGYSAQRDPSPAVRRLGGINPVDAMAAVPPQETRKPRVLGVEPDPVTRRLMELYLQPQGYDVRMVSTLEAALELNVSGQSTVFFLNAESVDGATARQLTRLRSTTHGNPVFFIAEEGQHAFAGKPPLNALGTLTKPLRADAVLNATNGGAGESGQGAGIPRDPVFRLSQEEVDILLGPFQSLIEEVEMDGMMIRELTASFLERGPMYLREMRDALRERQLERLDRAVHTMKGMCGNLRFSRLVEYNEQIGRCANAARFADLERLLSEMDGEFHRLRGAIEQRWPPRH